MSAILVWVHKDHAKLFHLKPKSIHVETVSYKGPTHAIESMAVNHPKSQTDEASFYQQLSHVLEKMESAKWLLMGPSLGAQLYHRYLQSHHPQLAERVIGIERVEQMPDSEILSVGRQFLHQYYLYQGVIN